MMPWFLVISLTLLLVATCYLIYMSNTCLSKRDQIAIAAMQGILTSRVDALTICGNFALARKAYDIADVMILVRQESNYD